MSGVDLSRSRSAALRSTAAQPDTADRLDPFRLAAFAVSGRLADRTVLPLAMRGIDDTPVRQAINDLERE